MEFLLLVILLLLSGAFSGAETAFFSLDEPARQRLRQRGGAGEGAFALGKRPNDLLTALLIGNLLVNSATGVLVTSLSLDAFGPGGLAVAVPAATILLLLIGEITPKILALGARERVVLIAQRPLRVWVAALRPIVRLLTWSIEALLHRLPARRTGNLPLTTAELQAACDQAVEDAVLSQTEGRSLARLLTLHDLHVHQVMTPRPDVVTVGREWTRGRLLERIKLAGYNRYPVVEAGAVQPIGLFHVKDLLERRAIERPLLGALRTLPMVPESKDVAALIAEMRTGSGHLAGVVDEHGDFVGIVSLADCLQALIGRVGDVKGRQPAILKLGDRRWLIRGGLDLRALGEFAGVGLSPSRDYATVAGFVMARLGRIPVPGDRLVHGDTTFTVLAMQGHRVETLEVERAAPQEARP